MSEFTEAGTTVTSRSICRHVRILWFCTCRILCRIGRVCTINKA